MSGAVTVCARRGSGVEPVSSALHGVRIGGVQSTIGFVGVCALVLFAPFETTDPLVRLPWQSLSSVEVVILLVLVSWMAAVVTTGDRGVRRTPLTLPLVAFVVASLIAALAAPIHRANALHMTGRLALAGGVFAVTVAGVTTRRRVEQVILSGAAVGVVVSALMFCEYGGTGPVLAFLRQFRPGLSVVGAQVRAGGPFQYPTIASMYLEVTFALTLCLLPPAIRARHIRRAAVLFIALAIMAEGVVLTFTRAGLVTVGASLLVVAAMDSRRHGFGAGAIAIAVLAAVAGVEVLSSRSIEAVRLRMTTETQDAWYAARIVAPPHVSLRTGGVTTVRVTVTNTGRVTWQPDAVRPFRFSYHWLSADSGRVVVWEGARTMFAKPVAAGETVTLEATVEAPRAPGAYRLAWDVEQEHQLWFSSEVESTLAETEATVSGPAFAPLAASPVPHPPKARSRPGRMTLWRAAVEMFAFHPLTGVGLDNYRLLYGPYADLADADRRVHSNNMYLEILAGTGIVGVMAAGWLGWRAACSFLAAARHSLAGASIFAAGVAFALHGLVDSFLSFTATYLLMAITLGLSVAVTATDGAYADRV